MSVSYLLAVSTSLGFAPGLMVGWDLGTILAPVIIPIVSLLSSPPSLALPPTDYCLRALGVCVFYAEFRDSGARLCIARKF